MKKVPFILDSNDHDYQYNCTVIKRSALKAQRLPASGRLIKP
jgi:hypothetical protein